MRDYAVMNRTLWSGVINYIKASAQNAEALKPWSFKEEKEALTVLVFRTTVDGFSDQALVFPQLNEIVGKNNWTIDLDDVDKVLRVIGLPSNIAEIITVFKTFNFNCEIMK